MKKFLVLLSLLPALFAATACNETGLSAKSGYSGFDNARTVNITPHGCSYNSNSGGLGTGIGAQWNAANAGQVFLIIAAYDSRPTGITGAQLNIDGEKITLMPGAGSTDFDSTSLPGFTISTKGFITQMSTVDKILRSRRTWLRVYTTSGSVENAVIENGDGSKAYYALKRFSESVRGSGA